MQDNPHFEGFLRVLKEIEETEIRVTQLPQFKLIDNYAHLLVEKPNSAPVFIELGRVSKEELTSNDLKELINIYCFESVHSTADEKIKHERLFVIIFLLIGHPNASDAYAYADSIAFGKLSGQTDGALKLLFHLAVASEEGIRREGTLKLLSQHLDSFNNAYLHQIQLFINQFFSNHPVGKQITAKIQIKLIPPVTEAQHANNGISNDSNLSGSGWWAKIRSLFN